MLEEIIKTAEKFGNEEFVKELRTFSESNASNISEITGKVNHLESELSRSISKRDTLKSMIRDKTGIEEVSEESFSAYISDLHSKNSSDDVRKLQSMLDDTKTSYEGTISEMKQKVITNELNLSILETGALDGVKSSIGKNLILEKLREGLSVKDGEMTYVADDGSTVFDSNGKPLTVGDKLSSLYESEDYSVFFPAKKGGGKEGDKPNTSKVNDLSKLTRSEKAKLMASMTPSEWQDLVRANIALKK